MSVRFLHAADVHLGFEQYGVKERYNDFGRAFEWLVDVALSRHVDFLLLAGDLFHKRSIGPQTLFQAVSNLRRLKQGGIPVVAIEGNHDRSRGQGGFSWLDYLAETGLLVLLSPIYEKGQIRLDLVRSNVGTYIDLPDGIRVLGMKYFGASTPHVVEELAGALPHLPGPRPAYTILMLHAGLQGILDEYSATLTRAQLDPLRSYVDYLALGHIHKPFAQDDWIYNPGSLETYAITEVEWEDRGCFLVDVDSSRDPAHTASKIPSPRRAFERLSFPVDRYREPEALYAAFQTYVDSEATPDRVARRPVVELRLTGVLAFDRSDLDISRLEDTIKAAFQPIVCRIRDDSAASEFEISTRETMSRIEMERHVLRELVERDIRRRGDSQRWASMILQLKRMALAHSAPQEIVAELRAFTHTISREGRPC